MMTGEEILVRTYYEGKLYREGWTRIDTLWNKGYLKIGMILLNMGRVRMKSKRFNTIVEFIVVS